MTAVLEIDSRGVRRVSDLPLVPGKLNILQHKTWNVWNRDNIEKVRSRTYRLHSLVSFSRLATSWAGKDEYIGNEIVNGDKDLFYSLSIFGTALLSFSPEPLDNFPTVTISCFLVWPESSIQFLHMPCPNDFHLRICCHDK